MSRNWMPIYWGDYLRDTRHFNTEQHGAYLLLIAHYWQNGSLPTDEGQLATIAGLTVARWRKLSPPVAAKFSPDWTHGRIDKEIAKADHKIVLRQIAGQKGGLKSGITKAIARANAIPNAVANGIAKTKQSRTNHKERDITSSEQDAAREASVPTTPSNLLICLRVGDVRTGQGPCTKPLAPTSRQALQSENTNQPERESHAFHPPHRRQRLR
jgi:uncharacterized protein YdaU (DUF1376 family)